MANVASYIGVPKNGWIKLTGAVTSLDGIGAGEVFTAGSKGAYIKRITVQHLGTNVQTVLRVYENNGSDSDVAGNNSLVFNRTIPANTLSQSVESLGIEIALDRSLPPGVKIS